MNRRDFLTAGVRAAVLGFAVYTGLGATRIKQINEYGVLCSYTDKEGCLYENGIPDSVKDLAFQQMDMVATLKRGRVVDYKVLNIPPRQKDKSDPYCRHGFLGFTFHLDEAV